MHDCVTISCELTVINKYIITFFFSAKLTKWGVTDNDLFYAYKRRKDQPGEVQLKSLPGRDHEIGNCWYDRYFDPLLP